MRSRRDFLDFKRSVKMSSEDQKMQLSSPSKWHEKMSRRPSDEFKNGRKNFSLQKVKVTYRSEPTGHGTEEMSSITQQQEYKSSVELKCTKNSDIHIYIIYCMESFFLMKLRNTRLIYALTLN